MGSDTHEYEDEASAGEHWFNRARKAEARIAALEREKAELEHERECIEAALGLKAPVGALASHVAIACNAARQAEAQRDARQRENAEHLLRADALRDKIRQMEQEQEEAERQRDEVQAQRDALRELLLEELWDAYGRCRWCEGLNPKIAGPDEESGHMPECRARAALEAK